MHLTKRILPFIVQQALLGRTWADQAVFDSPGDLGSIKAQDGGSVFIAVYCDEWDLNDPYRPEDKATPGMGAGYYKLVIEVGASKPIVTESDDDGPVSEIAATDPGLEWTIAFISRQVFDTLTARGVGLPWSALFLRWCGGKPEEFSARRGGPANDGKVVAPRYASCVSILRIAPSTLEPPRGQIISAETYPLWSDLLELLKTMPDMLTIERTIRAHFEPVDSRELRPDMEAGVRMWVPQETIDAIGLAPYATARYAPEESRPTTAPVRPDAPVNAEDMQQWLDAQQPDPSQGPPDGR